MKDPEMNRRLVTNGYITLPVLDWDQVEAMRQLYKKWHPTDPDTFYKSYFSSDRGYKIEVENAILRAFKETLDKYFLDHHAFGAMFVVKPKGEVGQIPPHQDWSFVDEAKYWSLNAWCPLIDTTSQNGNIQMLPGSHLFRETIRGGGTPELYCNLYERILKDVVDVPLKAGECVFFYHGIIHCSTFNHNDEARVTLGLSMVPQDAPIHYHFLKEGESHADCYRIRKTDFYLDYVDHRGDEPINMDHLGKNPYGFELISEDEYNKLRDQHASLHKMQESL